jgi:L-threonylcarbamoyladenylate synthase
MSGVSERYNLLDPDEADKGITAAMAAMRAGELIVIPTDTVYGVAAEAFDQRAVARLLRAKDRGRDVPTPVLIGSAYAMEGLADDVDETALKLTEAFWPGGLSLVFKQQPSLNWDLGDNKGTVMLRMPDNDHVLQLLRRTGPLAVSSANRHGRPAPTTVDVAEAELGDRVSVYLDGGETPGAVPSTIVDLTRVVPQLLRRGVITLEQLRDVVGAVEIDIDGEDDVINPDLLAKLDADFAELQLDREMEPVDDDEAEPTVADDEAQSTVEGDDAEPVAEHEAQPVVVDDEPEPTVAGSAAHEETHATHHNDETDGTQPVDRPRS